MILRLILIAGFFVFPVLSGAEDRSVVAVLSSDMAPYQTALAGFQQVLNEPVQVVHLDRQAIKAVGRPRLVVAFGGKAALGPYPTGTPVIYCMAPGTRIGPGQHAGPLFQISMMPEPALTLRTLKGIHPNLKRVAVLWQSTAYEPYTRELRQAGREAGLEVRSERIAESSDLPELLRQMHTQVDALWLLSDPLLLNSQNLVILNQFSASAQMPLYSPVAGLTDRGATATVSVHYEDIGRATAVAAQAILGGSSPPEEIYPKRIQTVIHAGAAARAGLTLNEEAFDKDWKVIQ